MHGRVGSPGKWLFGNFEGLIDALIEDVHVTKLLQCPSGFDGSGRPCLDLLDGIFERVHGSSHLLAHPALRLEHIEHHGIEGVVHAVTFVVIGDLHRAVLIGHIARG
jgi:hypothetical protein